jgi:hypothetical protein
MLLLLTAFAGLLPVSRAQAQTVPTPPYYAMDPQSPMTPATNSPVQQQILENYRTQLQQVQRSLLRQDPSGTSRAQIEINRQLNGLNTASPPLPPAPSAGTAQPPR